MVTGQALGRDIEIGGDIVKPIRQQIDAAYAGEIALAWPVIAGCQQGTVNSHRLGCVFNAAGGAEPAGAIAQRIVQPPVTNRHAADAQRRPLNDRIEQTHATVMWNMGGDPGPV